MAPEILDRLGAAREAAGLRRRLVEADVERGGVGAKLPLERRLGPGLGFGRFARRIFGRAGHGAYLGRGRRIAKLGARPIPRSP